MVKLSMVDEDRVQQLLDEILDSGRLPDEVCAATPELFPEVHRRWLRLRKLEADLEALFPGPLAANKIDYKPCQPQAEKLPCIPGYEVQSVLGRGGMGIVFRARHVRLNRLVALKMALAGAYSGPQERNRFQREAEAVATLRHVNVVQIYDIGDSEGQPYFTMEYVEGGSLSQKLGGVPLSPRETASLIATLAAAVHAAHLGGIVHRDLKPANVLLTADGTPKISDFGLARRLDGVTGITQAGVTVGTPSYMPPEQASGNLHTFGPAVDIYALGAILYETLTGRPPFRADTAAETIRQVIAQDPVPPSRLNGAVARDLETICLKCLHKEPRHRYATADLLAEDLGRYHRGEAIAARPEGRLGRMVRRVRRKPLATVAAFGVPLLVLALLGTGLWLIVEKAAAARETDADLREMARLESESNWIEARAAFERANGRLGMHGSVELRCRLNQGARDLELVNLLERIRLHSATSTAGVFGAAQADREFEIAFQEAGFGEVGEDPDSVAARIRASNIRAALVAAIYHWVRCTPEVPRSRWLLAVSASAEPESARWYERVASSARLRDPATANAVALDPTLAARPVEMLLVVYHRLVEVGQDPIPFLIRVQQAHPTDFWANLTLGQVMRRAKNYPDAIRYGQAAVVLRPQAAIAHDYLGTSLRYAGRFDDAIAEHREALRIDPSSHFARGNIGAAFLDSGRHQEAIREFEETLRVAPNDISAHSLLGKSLEAVGRIDEAIDQYRRAIALWPGDPRQPADAISYTAANEMLRALLRRQGKWDDMLNSWRAHLDAPANPDERVLSGYPECCLFRGRKEEYQRACAVLLKQAGNRTDPRDWEVAGRAWLLVPRSEPDLRRAVTLIDRALATQRPNQGFHAFFLAAKGLAEYRSERYQAALEIMQGDAAGVLGPLPQLVVAMSHAKLRQHDMARVALAHAIGSFDWREEHADFADIWMYHILRREAEQLILPSPPNSARAATIPSQS